MDRVKLDELKKTMHDMKERIGKSDPGQIREVIKIALDQSRGIGRAGEFFVGADEPGGPKSLNQLFVVKSADADTIEFQKRADDVYLVSKILGANPRSTKIFQRFKQSELKKAMDTATVGEGLEWVPTGFSAELIERVKLALKVMALHERITMPTNPYTLPLEGTGAQAYLVPESTTDHDTETAGKIPESTPQTLNRTMTAKKIAARVDFSEEVTEDSIIPILPFIKKSIVRAMGEAEEDAAINGDTTVPHQDSDVTAATDPRKAWKGYRKLAQVSVNLGTFNLANLRSIRAGMGKYGVDPAKLAWVVGIAVYNKMLSLTEVVTVDKYGPNATILTGELGKLDNAPIIVSEKQRENLNASGVYDGSTTNRTVLELVYRDAIMIGDRRKMTTKTDENIITDQTVLVVTLREILHNVQPDADKFVGLGYNIAV